MHRRQALSRLAAFLAASAAAPVACVAAAPPPDLGRDLAVLERGAGGRLGAALLDASTGHVAGHRLDERFPMCGTFKLLLAAQVLRRVERDEDSLASRVPYQASDLQEWSPVTRPALARGGLDVAALCEAAVAWSDDTAANLLLRRSGGPAGLTEFVRGLGDAITRLDHEEPALDDWSPGQLEDTTTPRAMATTMRALIAGDALEPASRRRLRDWLCATRTGDHRLRAGLPKDWTVGDKTGTWRRATANDVAFVEPPGGPTWIVVAFLCAGEASQAVREGALADVGRLVAARVAAR